MIVVLCDYMDRRNVQSQQTAPSTAPSTATAAAVTPATTTATAAAAADDDDDDDVNVTFDVNTQKLVIKRSKPVSPRSVF